MMGDSFKQKVVPVLRENGFRRSFPHFYRVRDEAIDLLNVQHHKHGGGFRLNIGRVPAAGQIDAAGMVVAPRVLQIANLGMEKRAQIKPERDVGRDGWYRFDRHPCWEVSEAALARIIAKDHWAKLPMANLKSGEV